MQTADMCFFASKGRFLDLLVNSSVSKPAVY